MCSRGEWVTIPSSPESPKDGLTGTWPLENGSSAVQRIHETWPIRTCITFGGLSTAQQHFNFESLQNGPGGQIT
jgi:hypothetical protein